MRMRRIIDLDQGASWDTRKVHMDNLYAMVAYNENVTDCRRSQLLQYFGERNFARQTCGNFRGSLCDNCGNSASYTPRDVTHDAQQITRCVKELNDSRGRYTLLHIVEIFKGSQADRIQKLGHTRLALHGQGKSWGRQDAERLLRKMVVEGVLKEDLQITAMDTAACYIGLGPRAADLMRGNMSLELAVQGGKVAKNTTKTRAEPSSGAPTAQDIEDACVGQLRNLARAIAAEHGVKNSGLIFPERALSQMAQRRPVTAQQLVAQIDHFNPTIVEKYQAQRFLDITKQCRDDIAALQPAPIADDSEDEWTSHYFAESSSTGARGRGRGKGGKRGRRSYKKGKYSAKRGNSGFSQFKYKSKAGTPKTSKSGTPKAGTSSGSNGWLSKSSGAKDDKWKSVLNQPKARMVTKNNLGLMPDPRSRSFLK